MRIIPAIDIMDGKAVRLTRGKFDDVEMFGDPLHFASQWIEKGAKRLHLVDLDGARIGVMKNFDIVSSIIEFALQHDVEVEVGGGIRSIELAERLISKGARVVIGTSATNSSFIRTLSETYGSEWIIGAIDAREGKVSVRGWQHTLSLSALSLAKKLESDGVGYLLFTDIERDGTLGGVALQRTAEIVQNVSIKVIASGGVSSLADLDAVAQTGAWGVIVGKALYKKYFDLSEAILRYPD